VHRERRAGNTPNVERELVDQKIARAQVDEVGNMLKIELAELLNLVAGELAKTTSAQPLDFKLQNPDKRLFLQSLDAGMTVQDLVEQGCT
jgi:hypothetical protein